MVYQPDPIASMLVDPNGGQGWAVGGFVESEQHGGLLDTADIARYRDASAPPGLSAVPVKATKCAHCTSELRTA